MLWDLAVEELKFATHDLYKKLESDARSRFVSETAVLVGAGGRWQCRVYVYCVEWLLRTIASNKEINKLVGVFFKFSFQITDFRSSVKPLLIFALL